MTEADYGWVGDPFREQVSTQRYGGGVRIEGVRLIDLVVWSDEGGDFCEIVRLGEGGTLALVPDFAPKQINYSYMEPGTIKAWHLHRFQDDLWFVPPRERLLIGLLDTREESPTHEVRMRLVLGAGKARLLYIPRGVAHGVANLTARPANLLYLVNATFDAGHPDEHRLPFDLLGADFWAITPG